MNFERFMYKRRMFKAFEIIRKSSTFKDSTKHQALRTIRDFERVNGVEFDPTDSLHVSRLNGLGAVGGSVRSLELKFNRMG